MTPEEFQRLGYALIDAATLALRDLRARPVYQRVPEDTREALLSQPLPIEGQSSEDLLAFYKKTIFPYPFGNDHPRFFAWVNSSAAPIGMLWKLAATITSPSMANGDHAALYETYAVIRWLMELVGFPVDADYPSDEGSMGILVEGGSLASFHGLAAARQWAAINDGWDARKEGMQHDHRRLIIYATEEGHSCLIKSAEALGFGAPRIIATDSQFKMDLKALKAAIDADRQQGLRPCCVAATAGTVATGAIDPLEALANLCEQEGLWLHVDGAMGGFGVLDERKAHLYIGMNRAHSLALDPHKWLNVPIDCSALLVRKGKWLRQSFSKIPSYLWLEAGKGFGGVLPGFAEYNIKQTQQFLAAPLGAVLRYAGRDGLAHMIAHHNTLAQYLVERIAEYADLECMAPAELCIVCFRYVPSERRDQEFLNMLNKRLTEMVQERGKVFLHHVMLKEHLVLRACIMHYATSQADLDALIDEVRTVGALCMQEHLANFPSTNIEYLPSQRVQHNKELAD
ncbi:aminotransferase class V-fold PLP-dependent enzyme [Ktedonosporobacter rubrisoli]|uniref:Aminotransferase class V-fold PLP-dependent enzyme n=2 Tax=Ktedonosporobacter rubrisoli TaxID=2509675 RepID=A0A4P6K6K6_KTERU|nr:aminotransferase class V-fold PLP-dependent enzyme [Ktedonosporobacter rubrisoli]